VLLRPLPYAEADRLVELNELGAKGTRMHVADPNFEDLRAQNHSLEGVAEHSAWLTPVSGGSEPTRTMVAWVSRDFFPILRVQPALGRAFAPDDERFGAEPVALVSYAYWRQYLGGVRDLSALELTVDKRSASVIGVLPAGFQFPDDSDIWMPRELLERYPSRTAHNWNVLGRLRDGVPLGRARADASAIAARLKRQYGKDTMMVDAAIVPLQEFLTGRARPTLLIVFGAVGFLLLIACANVVNLLFAQAAGRDREVAIRTALGAGRRRLVRQFLTEALLLALAGGALGVLAAMWGVRALVAVAPHDLPRLDAVEVNLPVLLFALGVSVLIACALGVLTALSGPSRDLQRPLADGRGQAGAARAQRAGRLVIAAQLAITLVLLVGAGLLGRSLLRVIFLDPGFHTEHLLTMDLALPGAEQPDDSRLRGQFLHELFTRLRAIPGVQDVGGTNALPLAGGGPADGTYLLMNPQDAAPRDIAEYERFAHDAARAGDADFCVASDGYFRALGIPLLGGRPFDDRDTMDTPHVALISQSLARDKFAGRDPLGHLIEFGNMDGDLRLLTIVGIVGDVRAGSLESPPRPTVYVNYRQRSRAASRFTVVMRTDAAAAAVFGSARQIVRALDPTVPPSFSTFSRIFSASLDARRFNLTLIAVFACTALLLAVVGIYGVTAYSVARLTREIGVRMALGATAGSVLRLVLGRGMATAAAGLAVGIVGSLALTRTMQFMLFGVSATDPVTFVAVALLLAAVALLASYVPARRATRVDPQACLRYE
jgi:predicted permease